MKTNDVDLIHRILDGDEGAFTALVEKYQKWVHTLVWRKVGDFHIAEEITQDVFLKVYKKLATLKHPDRFPGWLYVIATRHCLAWLRKKRLSTKSLDAMSKAELEDICYTQYQTAHSEASEVEHQREIIKRLLQRLPESERTVVSLYYLAEMTGEEISSFLGVSPSTIRSRLRRARKRLETQEHLLHDASEIFQLSPTLTENIMREVARIKPSTSSVSKPWIPWGFSLASTFLIILIMGVGFRALSRFQQHYDWDATSEMTVQLIEAPTVLPLKLKPDARTQFGRADVLGKNRGSGFQAKPLLNIVGQADEVDAPVSEPQWIQTKGPGGVSSAGLFRASDQTLYAIAKPGLYRLTEQADAWTFVSASGPNREFAPVMAEHGNTLYLLTSDELLASSDKGKIWTVLGTRPEGRAVALIITDGLQQRSSQHTDITVYLVLKTEVFRSQDAGQRWEPIGEVLWSDSAPDVGSPDFRIWDALAIDNTLFVGTTRGLFRFTDDWEKMPVPTLHGVQSLSIEEGRLYIGTITNLEDSPLAEVYYSTDLGDSWTDITPTHVNSTKRIVAFEVVPVGNTLMLVGFGGVLLSYDGGETWTDLEKDPHAFGPFPALALDENNFYRSYHGGITRSTDGGITWHPFMTGLVSSEIRNLVAVENALYASTYTEIVRSKDHGESWESVGLWTDGDVSLKGAHTKIATANDVFYISNSNFDDVTLFHLNGDDHVFLPVEGVPDFEEDTLYTEWQKKRREPKESNIDVDKVREQWRADDHNIAEEWATNGTFTFADETVFMEYRHKLYRWRHGESEWYDTGLEDIGYFLLPDESAKGLTLAVSGNTVYTGKRDGCLFQSLDNGENWYDVTETLAFSFEYFKEILFAGATVYVSTDTGVMTSHDGESWSALTDASGNRIVMDRIAVNGTTVYGVCNSGVYQVDTQTNMWKQISPEVPYTVTSFTVNDNMFYIGTKHNGVLRFQRTG